MRENEYFIGSETKSFSENQVFKAEQYAKTTDYNPPAPELKKSGETGLEEHELGRTKKKTRDKTTAKTLRDVIGKTAGGVTTAAVATVAAAVVIPALLNLEPIAPTVNGLVVAADAFSYDFDISSLDSNKEYVLLLQGGSGSGAYSLVDGDGIITGLSPSTDYTLSLMEKGAKTAILTQRFTTAVSGSMKALFDVDTVFDYEKGLAHANYTAYFSGYENCEALGVSPMVCVDYLGVNVYEYGGTYDGFFVDTIEDVAQGELKFYLIDYSEESASYGEHTERIRFAPDFTPVFPTVYDVQASALNGLAEVTLRCDREEVNFYASTGGNQYGGVWKNYADELYNGACLLGKDATVCDVTVYYEHASGMLSPIYTQNNVPCVSPAEYGEIIKETIDGNLEIYYGEDYTGGYLVASTDAWENEFFGCALKLTDASGSVISYQTGVNQVSFEIPATTGRVNATLYKIGRYYDGEKIFEEVDLGEINFTRPTLTMGESAVLTNQGWKIPFTVNNIGAEEMRIDDVGVSIVYNTSSGSANETTITYGQQQYFSLDILPSATTYAEIYGYISFTDVYGNTGILNVPEMTYTFPDTFEIERVEYNAGNGVLTVNTLQYYASNVKMMLRNVQTGEEISEFGDSVSVELTDGVHEYEVYLLDEFGNTITPVKSFTVDTALASGEATMQTPHYTQILTTYNENNTMNFYPVINFSSEDEGLQAEVVVNGNQYYRTRGDVCVIEDLICGSYTISYQLIREVESVVYLIESTSYSGEVSTIDASTISVSAVYDETADETTITIRLNSSYIYDMEEIYIQTSAEQVQLLPENITNYQATLTVSGEYTWGYLLINAKNNNADLSAVETYVQVKGSTSRSLTISYY